jgi:hypothetical protein
MKGCVMTYTEKVAAYFRAHPGAWIDGRVLETIGGRYAWRSRVSDCRTRLGLTIENQVRTLRGADGTVLTRVSEYRYTGFVSKTEDVQVRIAHVILPNDPIDDPDGPWGGGFAENH